MFRWSSNHEDAEQQPVDNNDDDKASVDKQDQPKQEEVEGSNDDADDEAVAKEDDDKDEMLPSTNHHASHDTNTNTTPAETELWSQSHAQTCIHLKSLYATPQQVWSDQDEGTNIELPRLRDVMVVTEENYETAALAVAEAYKLQREQQAAIDVANNSTTASWTRQKVGQFGSALYKLFLAAVEGEVEPDDFDEEKEWNPVADDAVDDVIDEEELVDWNDDILNIDLAVTCCQQLVKQQEGAEEVMIMRVNGSDSSPSLLSWCRKVGQEEASSNSLLQHISQKEAVLLAHALCALGMAKLVNEGTVLAVGPSSSLEPPALDVAVALFELDCALLAAEDRIDQYEEKAQVCGQAALEAKHQGKKSKAVWQMKQRQLYLREVEKSRGAILNLETSRHVLEQAQSQQQVLASLQATSQTLQSMRSNAVSVEQVDDIVLDHEEQVEQLTGIEQTLVELTMVEKPAANELDGVDLLKELEELSEETIESPAKQAPLEQTKESTRIKKSTAEASEVTATATVPPAEKENDVDVCAKRTLSAAD